MVKRRMTSAELAARRESQASGKAWEQALEGWHGMYKARGMAFVQHRGPPTKVINRRLVTVGKGPTDYGGLLAGGRAVDFDAKTTTAPRWGFVLLKPHQADHLGQVSALGGVAFVALQTSEGSWVVPWAALAPLWSAWQRGRLLGQRTKPGTGSLTADDCDRLGARMARPGDWYPALVALGLVEAA